MENHERHELDEAIKMIRKVAALNSRGWGDNIEALRRFCEVYRLNFWTFDRIRNDRAKTISGGLLLQLRSAYSDFLKAHQQEISEEIDRVDRLLEAEQAFDGDISDIVDEIARIEARLEEIKRKRKEHDQ